MVSTTLPKEVQSCGAFIPSQKDVSPVQSATDLRKIPAASQNITSLPQELPAFSGSGMALTDKEKFEVGCLIFSKQFVKWFIVGNAAGACTIGAQDVRRSVKGWGKFLLLSL